MLFLVSCNWFFFLNFRFTTKKWIYHYRKMLRLCALCDIAKLSCLLFYLEFVLGNFTEFVCFRIAFLGGRWRVLSVEYHITRTRGQFDFSLSNMNEFYLLLLPNCSGLDFGTVRNDEREHPCFVPGLRMKAFNILGTDCSEAVDLSRMSLCCTKAQCLYCTSCWGFATLKMAVFLGRSSGQLFIWSQLVTLHSFLFLWIRVQIWL